MAWVLTGAGILGIAGITTAIISSEAAKQAAAAQAGTAMAASGIQSDAATTAAATQSSSAQAALDQQAAQFASMQELMAPWVNQGTEALGQLGQYEATGTDALKQQRALMGLDGPEAQRAAMEGISGSPEMMGMVQQGENAMMQQGAATGGLRGGNIQGALAQFRPQMLSQLINQQYGKLGGLINMGQGITMNRAALGQASAMGVGSAGMQNASSLSGLLMQQGNAIAGGQLGAGNAYANGILGYGNAAANAQLASGQAWGQVPNYFLQGGMMAAGMGGGLPGGKS